MLKIHRGAGWRKEGNTHEDTIDSLDINAIMHNRNPLTKRI